MKRGTGGLDKHSKRQARTSIDHGSVRRPALATASNLSNSFCACGTVRVSTAHMWCAVRPGSGEGVARAAGSSL